MRLIDADAAAKKLREYYGFDKNEPYGGVSTDAIAALSVIDNAPAIDAEPVRYSSFKFAVTDDPVNKYGECNLCGRYVEVGDYCSRCGARMDGDENK